MSSPSQTLLDKLQRLPSQRLAEVEDFVEFLVIREERTATSQRLGNMLTKLDALQLSPLSDEEIEAEIKLARQSRNARGT